MKILVVDSGGRGHAVAWNFLQDPKVKEVICAPGNAGIATEIRCFPVTSIEDLLQLAKEERVDLTIVGPESYIAEGMVNRFQQEELPIIGPTKMAGLLESSKAYTKILCQELNIPVAEFEIFEDPERAKAYIRKVNYPVVVKADGLAQGKGSIVCSNPEEAMAAIQAIMVQRIFDEAGNKVVVERRLFGQEISFFFFCDGWNLVPMPVAQDYKRAFDNDQGPNTGGMGAYSPHSLESEELTKKVTELVAKPLIDGFREKRGILYQGILYLGLMLVNGIPHVLEVNVRHGDPEAEVILPRLETPMSEICLAIKEERLKSIQVKWSQDCFCDVILVSGKSKHKGKGKYPGYPGRYAIGFPISGLEEIDTTKTKIFFAGVRNDPEKGLVTHGGRILHVVGHGATLEEAREVAYQEAKKIRFQGKRCRHDIGLK